MQDQENTPRQAEPRAPISSGWRSWIEGFPAWAAGRLGGEPDFDAIVVGSGYGGSVAALRLAQKGYSVLVLERGSEYLPGEFPNDVSLLPKNVRVNIPGRAPAGRASGLVEVHLGQGLAGVTGNGLGGGSLINAGVVVRPDADVFAQDAWPAPIRTRGLEGLAPWMNRAQRQLQATRWAPPAGAALPKTVAFQGLAKQVGRAMRTPDLTIDPKACVRCGDCASGCNVPGAKRDLAATYLAAAVDTGRVQIVTQAEVYRFEPTRTPARLPGWSVHVFATDAQHEVVSVRELMAQTDPASTVRSLSAPLLFICAGTFGSTQLLQRSQALGGGRLAFSPSLGARLSGNGDALTFLAGQPQPVDAVGRGLTRGPKGCRVAVAPVGPTITGMVDLRGRPRLEQRVLIEDGAIPRAIVPLFHELLATAWTLEQLDHWSFTSPVAPGEDPLAASAHMAAHTQVLLTMGHDGSPGRVIWLEGLDRSAPYVPQPEALETYAAQQALFDGLEGTHLHNPLWKLMPDSATSVMAGKKPQPTITTVHPLGGCAMSDHPDHGVVDHRGQVWVHDPGARGSGDAPMEPPLGTGFAGEPRRYAGLYVLDGSIVPTALGCNPLLTITALAERALDQIVQRPGGCRAPQHAVMSPARSPDALDSVDVKMAVRLDEELVGRELRLSRKFDRLFEDGRQRVPRRAEARLNAEFSSPDFLQAMAQADHPLAAQVTLRIAAKPCRSGEAARTALVYASQVVPAGFLALPAGKGSSGRRALWAALRDGGLMLLAAVGSLGSLAVAIWLALGTLAAVVQAGFARLPWADVLASLRGFGVQVAMLLGFLLLTGLLVLVLPLGRTVLTWLIQRGWKDLRDWWVERGRMPVNRTSLASIGAGLLRQWIHALETRTMVYRIPLSLAEDLRPTGQSEPPQELVLNARKRVVYRASTLELVAWLLRRCGRSSSPVDRDPGLRPSYWQQIMDADVRLVGVCGENRGSTVAAGWMRMGFDNLVGAGRSPGLRNAPPHMQLVGAGDATTGLLALAAFPMVFLRFAFKTRLLDFRLPTYSQRPIRDDAPPSELRLRTPAGPLLPERHEVQVRRGASSSDCGEESTADLSLPLWRYRRPSNGATPGRPEVARGDWLGVPVARAKSVLLLHAFGQSGLTFTFRPTRKQDTLAEAFYREGYEVWILETRMSTRSGYAADPCTVDDIGAHDVPAAVEQILHVLRSEGLGDGLPLQICAFAQCIGAAALWMALLSGKVSHGIPARRASDGRPAPRLSKLSAVMSSQVHPWVVGSRLTQSKTWMPVLLQALFNRAVIPFAVRGRQDGLMANVLDRLFATMPAPEGEDRRHVGTDDAAATCRRIRYIEAPLFLQDNINNRTHRAMNRLFGDANVRLFSHARRFVDHERLVDEDGVNRYVTDDNIREHLALPVQLLHGQNNELFDMESARRSHQALQARRPEWHHAAWGNDQPLLIEGYGHLDVLIGKNAATQVFPAIVGFFRNVAAVPAPKAAPQPQPQPQPQAQPRYWIARPPRVGPFLGWLRSEAGQVVLRFSFIVDDPEATLGQRQMPFVRVRLRASSAAPWTTVAGARLALRLHQPKARPPVDPSVPAGRDRRAVIDHVVSGDLTLPPGLQTGAELQFLTLMLTTANPTYSPNLLSTPNPDDATLTAHVDAQGAPSPLLLSPVSPSPGSVDRPERAIAKVPVEAIASLDEGKPVRFVAASCRYPGFGIDPARVDQGVDALLLRQASEPAAFGILLGDQIYADATAGLVDPSNALERYHERHETAFSSKAMHRLLATLPTYMTPDDHEWIDGYPAGGPLLKERWARWEPGTPFARRERRAFDAAASAITAYQRMQQPATGNVRDDLQSYEFQHGCVRVFVIDTRFARGRQSRVLVKDAVFARLAQWLQAASAACHLNVVASGSVVLPGLIPDADPANPGPLDTWQYAPQQRRRLLELLLAQPNRFLLLSGDYHVSAALELLHGGAVVGAAIVAPPLYAPLAYANAAPQSLHLGETLQVAGRPLTMRLSSGGDVLRGSGSMCIDVQRQSAGGYAIKVDRNLQVWENGAVHGCQGTILLP